MFQATKGLKITKKTCDVLSGYKWIQCKMFQGTKGLKITKQKTCDVYGNSHISMAQQYKTTLQYCFKKKYNNLLL